MKITGSRLIRAAGLSAVVTGILFAAILPIQPPDALTSANTRAFIQITTLKWVTGLPLGIPLAWLGFALLFERGGERRAPAIGAGLSAATLEAVKREP